MRVRNLSRMIWRPTLVHSRRSLPSLGLRAPALAWTGEPGSRSVFVAVVDTGVWWTHNDILANMWSNTDGTHGYDFIDSDTNPMDEDTAGGPFHGTGVARAVACL